MPRTRPQRMSAPMSASGGKAEMLRMAPIRPIPVVFMANGDPVASGLVASLNRPGGNMTGVTIFGMMAVGKRLELLRQVIPKAGPIAYLMNPNNPNREIDSVQAAASRSDCKSLLSMLPAIGSLTLPLRPSPNDRWHAPLPVEKERSHADSRITQRAPVAPVHRWSRSPGIGGRNPSERVVAINWNEWSRSIGSAGRSGARSPTVETLRGLQ
jgi:hypothetical protein